MQTEYTWTLVPTLQMPLQYLGSQTWASLVTVAKRAAYQSLVVSGFVKGHTKKGRCKINQRTAGLSF